MGFFVLALGVDSVRTGEWVAFGRVGNEVDLPVLGGDPDGTVPSISRRIDSLAIRQEDMSRGYFFLAMRFHACWI